MKFNEKLINLRKSKNLTQQGLAEQINYSDKVISKWENGYSCPDMQALIALAKFYEISVDELISSCELAKSIVGKKFPIMPKIFLHILLVLISVYLIVNTICLTMPKFDYIYVGFDYIFPLVLCGLLIVLSILDLVFVYKNLSRKIIIILIFSLICALFALCIIAFIMYGGTTVLTEPLIFFCISIVVCTAFGFISNKKI